MIAGGRVPGSSPHLILASASPRRREILTALRIPFDVVVPEVEEVTEGAPEEVVLENARRKAAAGIEAAEPGAVVLGVDTDVALDGRTLGKPTSPAGARERLEALAGRVHTVLSAVVLCGAGREAGAVERSGVSRSEVTFAPLDERTIEMYVDSGEWRGRAGGYAIQGLGSLLVERVDGDFSNVVGLPLRLLFELAPELREAAAALAPERGDSD
jgi:septum formation protein